MSHAGPFVTSPDEALYGYGYPTQTLTVSGSPTGGTFRVAFGRRIATGSSVAYNASAATLQTHIRTIPEFSSCVVTGSNGGPWTVDNTSADHSTPALLTISANDLTGGTQPYIAISGSPDPLIWKMQQPVLGSVTPLAPKMNVGGEESAMTTQASEWDIRAPLRLGRRDMKEREDPQVMWDGNAITFIDGQITKPFKQTAPTFAAAGERNVYHYAQFNGTILKFSYYNDVANNYALERWTSGTNTWTAVTTTVQNATIGQRLGWASYQDIFYCTHAQGYARITTGWAVTLVTTTSTADVTAFCVYDGKLIRMESTGQLAYTVTAAADEADWVKPVTAVINDGSSVIAMEVFSDPMGQQVIFVLTTSGLWIYDWSPSLFRKVVNVRANSPSSTTWENTGKGQLVAFGDSLWAIVDGSVYRYQSNGTVSNIGPWVDQGLPTAGYNFSKRMRAWSLWPVNNWLFCAMASESAFSTAPSVGSPGSTPTHLGAVLGWNGQGWYIVQGPQPGIPNRAIAYETTFDPPKLFLGSGRYILFNDAIGNPLYWSSQTYQDTGVVITPWFNGSLQHVQHVALMGYVWCYNFTSTENAIIYYQVDDAADSTATNTGSDPRKHWKQVLDKDGSALTISATTLGGPAGLIRFYFDRQTADDAETKFSQGQPFYTIRLRIELSGGTADTNTPVVKFVKVLHQAQFESTDEFSVQFVLEQNVNGRTAMRQWNDFKLLHELAQPQPFALHDHELHVVKERNYRAVNVESGYVASPSMGDEIRISLTLSETTAALSEH